MKTYVTHGGRIHADETGGYATCLLAGVCDRFLRLENLDDPIPPDSIVSDIKREYDPDNDKFDHHQGLFPRDNGHPMASFGMIWKEYGFAAVYNALSGRIEKVDDLPTISETEQIAARVDKKFVTGIDANDVGYGFDIDASTKAGEIEIRTISGIIRSMNADTKDPERQTVAFREATSFMVQQLVREIMAAHAYVMATKDFHSHTIWHSPQILQLIKGMPWMEIIHEQYPETLFVISPSDHPGNPFSLQAVPVKPGKYDIKIKIERPEWFNPPEKKFIHQGQWIAGSDHVGELVALAKYNIASEFIRFSD